MHSGSAFSSHVHGSWWVNDDDDCILLLLLLSPSST